MAEPPVSVAAVDLGASSGRVVVGRRTDGGFSLHEVARFPNTPRVVDGVLRWDTAALLAGIRQGLRAAAVLTGGRLDAVSVDGWAVDYGLLDGDGELLEEPANYRDPRTGPAYAAVTAGAAGLDVRRLWEATGIATHPFNTVFQLMSDRGSVAARAARHALLVPDLMTYRLCGVMATELTNASTTQLLDPRTMTWADEVVAGLSVPVGLFPRLAPAGEVAGPMLPDLARELGLVTPPQLVLGPSHDTAAAVAGVPADGTDFGYVCTGTWALVGLELPAPVITPEARDAGFTNEVGVDGTIRFLRNVTGFWLLQECVREWQAAGATVDLDELTRAAELVPGGAALVDVQDPDLATPGGMTARLTEACRRAGGAVPTSRAELLRCILDSMAVAIRHAIRDAARIAGRDVRVLHVVGGGVANPLFCQLVADACDLPVVAGPTEAASWGNVLVQARALGLLSGSLSQLRDVVRRTADLTTYTPCGDEEQWERADRVVLSARAAAPA